MSLAWRLARSIRLPPIPSRCERALHPLYVVAEQPGAKVVEKRLEPVPPGADDVGDFEKVRPRF